MESLVNFWKGKKVFLTGHTGFKGSWLSLWLQNLQAEIMGFALDPPTQKNLFTEANVAKKMADIRGDIRDYKHLNQALSSFQPEIIFHLAAQPLVRYSYAHPLETYSTNVMGTVNLLEAARHCSSVKAIVNVTTDKCYENKEQDHAYLEHEPLGGYDPYSSSKACSELVTSAYRNSYFKEQRIGLASARAGNVIGGGDWAEDRLIPDLIVACLQNKSLQIRYASAIRPWQHVLESLSGYLRLAELLYHDSQTYAGAWNFGPLEIDAKSVSWIADEALRLWNTKITWEQIEQVNIHEATQLKLDSSKARSQLGWVPKWNVQQALESTIAWYKAYVNGADAKIITLEQISQYSLTV